MLRHELGHSIIDIGEEYDGGTEYFGVNAAHNLSAPLPWEHWLSNPTAGSYSRHVERSVMPMQEYPWTMLNLSAPWSFNFTSSGSYSRHLVRFSLSGLPDKNDITIELDRVALHWAPRSGIGLDRWHYDIYRSFPLSDGEHQLKFTLLNSNRQGIAQLCSVEILEFGDESEWVIVPFRIRCILTPPRARFESTPGYYGIFPTWVDRPFHNSAIK